MAPDPVIEKTLTHLNGRRDDLSKMIAQQKEAIKRSQIAIDQASKELAKVEQAIMGLKPLGPQKFLDKAGPAVAAMGAAAALMIVAIASARDNAGVLPPAPDLILGVLHEGGQMTDAEVVSRMEELGWASSSTDRLALVRSYLSRLTKEQRIARVGPSTYRLAVPAADGSAGVQEEVGRDSES